MRADDLIRVADADDERLVDYTALTDSRLRKVYEGRTGVFIAEGPNVVRRLFASPFRTKSVLLTEQREDEFGPEIPDGVPVFVMPKRRVYDLVRFKMHQGVIAVGWRRDPVPLDVVLEHARLVAVVEETNDPENLGVMFRNARALGVDAILVAPRCSDPLHRRTIRVSMGYVLHLPWAELPDAPDGLELLHGRGFTTVAMTPADDVVDIDDLQVGAAHRVAVLLGAEGPGLSDAALKTATVRARIPMRSDVDSINVSNAAAIAFHVLGRKLSR